MLTNTLHWSEVRKEMTVSGGTVQYCMGFADKCHQLRWRNAGSSVPKLQVVSWRQRKSTPFLQSPWSLVAPHVVPELVEPPGNLQMCRRQPSVWAAELETASQPASEGTHAQISGCRHRADTEAPSSSQVLRNHR